MKKTIIAIASASAFVASAAALATAPAASSAAGFYINGNLGYGHTALKTASAPGVHIKKNGMAWSANVGYQLNRNFAVEVGYMDVFGVKETVDNLKGSDKAEYSFLTADAKVIYPVSQDFDLFGKVGFAYESGQDVSDDGATTQQRLNRMITRSLLC